MPLHQRPRGVSEERPASPVPGRRGGREGEGGWKGDRYRGQDRRQDEGMISATGILRYQE
jgi:hypothetical protein